jgi:UDP-N-acetylmuramyl pentapeptide synthase
MANLWGKVAPAKRGAHAETSDGIRYALLSGLRAGDVVMIKGSLGSRMGPLAEAMRAKFPPAGKEN